MLENIEFWEFSFMVESQHTSVNNSNCFYGFFFHHKTPHVNQYELIMIEEFELKCEYEFGFKFELKVDFASIYV